VIGTILNSAESAACPHDGIMQFEPAIIEAIELQ
jgi:hypothetical protein